MTSKNLLNACKRLGDTIPADKLSVLNPGLKEQDGNRRLAAWQMQASVVLMRESWANFPGEERKALSEYMSVREGAPDDAGDDGYFLDMANWQHIVDLVSIRILELAHLREVMTAAEVQKEFGLAEATVRQAIYRGTLPARKSGETWLVLRKDAEARWGKK